MAINTKAIKTRIQSVENTKKITRAMQMIAAVKMKKAVNAAIRTREYSELSYDLMRNLAGTELNHPLAKIRKAKNCLLIVHTSNRGLCGSYNANITRSVSEYIDNNSDVNFSMIALGNKAARVAKNYNLELVGLYEKLNENPKYEDIIPLAKEMTDKFIDNDIDQVIVAYTNYISGLNQQVELREILPFKKKSIEDFYKNAGSRNESEEIGEKGIDSKDEYEFEPKKSEVLKYIIPILVEIQLYQALLESTASEHSSRMIAMKNASDAAGDMIDDLTLQFNKGRQAAITQEISEIVAGASALDN
ncbi:MAG: ATP synthase F1 subunit gamma [Candidatus Dojkabacteria bacterium]|nr:ATP synthase F1 subunit gamma [Candidatus Dojkabacteria bacterium]